jgi:hypothetical protein
MPRPTRNTSPLVTENDVTPSLRENDVARFMSYVYILPYNHPTLRSPCWIWTGAKSRGKNNSLWYGTFRLGKRALRAHRYAFDILGRGTCPTGCHRDHLCNVSLCVNPRHLEAVPREVNELRKQKSNSQKTGLRVLPPALVSENQQLHLRLWSNCCE